MIYLFIFQRSQDVPISPQSVFYSGSVSKQFVSACVGLLAIQGTIVDNLWLLYLLGK